MGTCPDETRGLGPGSSGIVAVIGGGVGGNARQRADVTIVRESEQRVDTARTTFYTGRYPD
jgi:hypothetical protein